jgi:hypothetical protein
VSVSGKLFFSLTPAGSPDSFKVQGSMDGFVDPGVPFGTSIQGSMGCTSLSAQLPEIVVGSGGIIYKLTGSMSGTFQAFPQGFPGGAWKASEENGACFATGSWKADRL